MLKVPAIKLSGMSKPATYENKKVKKDIRKEMIQHITTNASYLQSIQ